MVHILTIDEVIKNQRKLAEEFRQFRNIGGAFKEQAKKQIREYDQIAEWLEELKERRQTNFDYVSLMDKRYYDGYNNTIYDFVEKPLRNKYSMIVLWTCMILRK